MNQEVYVFNINREIHDRAGTSTEVPHDSKGMG